MARIKYKANSLFIFLILCALKSTLSLPINFNLPVIVNDNNFKHPNLQVNSVITRSYSEIDVESRTTPKQFNTSMLNDEHSAYLSKIIYSKNNININETLSVNNNKLKFLVNKLKEKLTNTFNSNNNTTVSKTSILTSINTRNRTANFSNLISRNTLRTSQIKPGQTVRQYAVELTVDEETFNGRAVIEIVPTSETEDVSLAFHAKELTINSVLVGLFTTAFASPAPWTLDDGVLEIYPEIEANSYMVIIEYTGQLKNGPFGLYQGRYQDTSYLAMNLHPTYARYVFPCMDEPSIDSTITFTFNDVGFINIASNSLLQENSASSFRPLQGPPHRWGMVAHSYNNLLIIPTANIFVVGRPGVTSQDAWGSAAINFYYNELNDWTNKPYFQIVLNQDEKLTIMAVSDIDSDWNALSTISIWEPYIFMESNHAIKQRYTALVKIAEAMARQWFGYVVYPNNWQHEWVTQGLATYAAYDVFQTFQYDTTGLDVALLDTNTLFVSEYIQESLYKDAYSIAKPLESDDQLFEEEDIRQHMNSLLKVKAPVIMSMLRNVLGNDDTDYVKSAARALLNSKALESITSDNFYDAVNSDWFFASNNKLIDDVKDFMENWIQNTGYPVIHVGLRQGGIIVTQESFGFSSKPQQAYPVPITYTSSVNPNFDNIYPIAVVDGTYTLNVALDEEDYVLFNIQGKGYYRVNYDVDLWERIIEALDDPDQRANIHPLNRATLVDDALNLARAGKLDYDIAFRVVLTMQHETEYPVWKAFIRNMEFLKSRLEAYVDDDDDDLDQDIYLRMVRRTIGAVESELGFQPDTTLLEPAMTSLTRALVMEHACKAGYEGCVAAAIDWFYDPNADGTVVNPNIPHGIRPAVYCTMVREGDDNAIAALYDRLEIEPTIYERVVILESLACSRDNNFINTYLEETIATNSPYSVEERSKIFAAVAKSGHQNAGVALNFMTRRINEIRQMYGGSEKLEALLEILAENMSDDGLSSDYKIWAFASNSNIGESENAAQRLADLVDENLEWVNTHRDIVYEWIDENDARTVAASVLMVCMSLYLSLF